LSKVEVDPATVGARLTYALGLVFQGDLVWEAQHHHHGEGNWAEVRIDRGSGQKKQEEVSVFGQQLRNYALHQK